MNLSNVDRLTDMGGWFMVDYYLTATGITMPTLYHLLRAVLVHRISIHFED